MATSLEFVPVDIDMADDPKVSYLLDSVGGADGAARFAAYGRVLLILQRVYHEGFYLRYGKFERIKLAKDMCMTGEELDGFLADCIDAELFDGEMFARGVITSRGIQTRYFKARKSKAVSDEDAPFVISAGGTSCEVLRETPKTREVLRETPKSAEKRRKAPKNADASEDEDEVKRSKEKRSKDDDRACAAASSSSSVSSDSVSDSAPADAGLPSLRERYPLCCMTVPSSPDAAYFDDAGECFATPLQALSSTYAHRTGGLDWERFAAAVARGCPSGCDCSPQRAEACARLINLGLEKFDPSKASNPAPLVRKILDDERGRAA